MAKKLKEENPPEKKTGKKAVIIANAKYDSFREEYERTKDKYAQHYPGGIEFIETQGLEGLQDAFGKVDQDEDLIMMAHYNPYKMYGVDVSNPSFGGEASSQDNTLAGLFQGLQNKGYKGNCYLGICHGEDVAQSIQQTGVNIPIFSTPSEKKWVGANTAAKGDFENFFFGISQGASPETSNPDMSKSSDPFTIIPKLGQDYIMNISPRQQELMDRRASGEPLKQVVPLDKVSMKKGGKITKKAEEGLIEQLGGVEGISNSIGNLLGGFQMLKQDKQYNQQADQLLALSDIVSQATSMPVDQPKRRYIRPEDMGLNPNEVHSSQGTGTNFLAKNGKSLPTYNVGGNIGNMLGSFIGGGNGQGSGAGQLGSTVGGIAGSIIPGLGTVAGGLVGGLIGGAIGGNKQKELQRKQEQAYSKLSSAALQQDIGSIQNQYSSFMENGGKVAMGGQLKVYNQGGMEVISQNPYLPGKGETIMFNGPSHAEGGIPVSFGNKDVEVEGGEPAVKLKNGSNKENLVIFGDMKIPSYGLSELNDPKAKGKKFKSYINLLSQEEDKVAKKLQKGVELVNEPISDSFDKLRFSSGEAIMEGSNMKLKDIAQKKQIAASVQDAILRTANELKLDSGELAKGKIKKAKKGAKIAVDGLDEPIPVGKAFKSPANFKYIEAIKALGNIGEGTPVPLANVAGGPPSSVPSPTDSTTTDKVNWMNVLNSIVPYIRPSNQTPLDPNQLSGEMFALATNQLEPVQAQTYQPLLESQSSISLQDQINANQSDFNALLKQTRNNPAAQSILAAQKYAANSSILGEQFRLNQAQTMTTMNRNRATLNDATLKNLGILDQQYTRQSQAKSATKATTQAALNSIADKMSRNKLENRILGVYENLYNYRFGPNGQAINMNPFAQFNTPQVGSNLQSVDDNGQTTNTQEWQTVYDSLGRILGSKKKERTTTKGKNGMVVKSLKSLI